MKTVNKLKTTFRTDGNFAIHVTDMQKAENFYGNVLGFKLISKTESQLAYDTGTVCLYINKDKKIISFIPALEVQDYEKAKLHLIENGCTIIKESDEHSALYFTDPFGLTIDIIEKK